MRIIFLGAPGAGKGTQAETVSRKLNIPTISTGNIIRAAIKDGTKMGLAAKEYTDKGLLVPDDVVIGIIKERLSEDDCKEGFVLDGFPRTIPQAESLDQMGIEIDKVINIHVPDETIIKRISGRRVCLTCGTTYHIEYKPTREPDKCDVCGSVPVQRKDDSIETVKERLRVYHEQTEPLIKYYEQKGKLRTVEGQERFEDTTALTLKALED
jgi:adenylate kinase